MSASDRPAPRAGDVPTNTLVLGGPGANSGGDGRAQLAVYKARVGSRGLTKLKGSLSERDWLVLHALDGLHFLSARQLERLLYQGSGLTTLSATRSCRRDLARLHEHQLIDRLERRIGGLRAGSASFIYSLGSNGARLLGHTTRRRSHEPSLMHLDHVLEIAKSSLHFTRSNGGPMSSCCRSKPNRTVGEHSSAPRVLG